MAQKQLHVTADIAFAIRNHFAATNDLAWLHREGCPMVREIATFWASRALFNSSSRLYDIRGYLCKYISIYNPYTIYMHAIRRVYSLHGSINTT